jgi:hypothetical protein
MTLINWAPRSPSEIRRDTTTYIRDIETGHKIECFHGSSRAEDDLRAYLGWFAEIEFRTIQDGPCEGFEVIYADGEAVAWIDEPPHSATTDEVREAVFPSTQLIAAE